MIIVLCILSNVVRLYLVSGVISGIGFWDVDFTEIDNPLNVLQRNYLECYRNEIVGLKSAKQLKSAINLNFDQLINNCYLDGYKVLIPDIGISFDIPLEVVENIFDFWFDIYKNPSLWKKSIGIMELRKKLAKSNYCLSYAFTGDSYECSKNIDNLLSYRPVTTHSINEPKRLMW